MMLHLPATTDYVCPINYCSPSGTIFDDLFSDVFYQSQNTDLVNEYSVWDFQDVEVEDFISL